MRPRFKGSLHAAEGQVPGTVPGTWPLGRRQPLDAVRRPASPERGPSAWNGSGAARPSRQSATYSASAGPCLKPCPEPPPSSHQSGLLRMAGDDEVRVGGQVVLADAGADSGASASAGKRRAAYSRASLLVRGSGSAVERVGVDGLAGQVGRDLHAEPAELAVAVERARRSRRTRACRPTRASTPKKKTSRREIRSSTSSGKSAGAMRRTPRRRRRRGGRPASTRPRLERAARARAPASPAARRSTPASGSKSTERRSSPPSDG